MRLVLIAPLLLAACVTSNDPLVSVGEAESNLQDFAALDTGEAQQVYAGMPVLERAALWQAQLTRQAADPRWSTSQRALLVELVDDVPAVLEHGVDDALGARLEATFSTDELIAAVGTLGGHGEGVARNPALWNAECDTRWCVCNLPGQMPEYNSCQSGCVATESGCGSFWSQACNKVCSTEIEELEPMP